MGSSTAPDPPPASAHITAGEDSLPDPNLAGDATAGLSHLHEVITHAHGGASSAPYLDANVSSSLSGNAEGPSMARMACGYCGMLLVTVVSRRAVSDPPEVPGSSLGTDVRIARRLVPNAHAAICLLGRARGSGPSPRPSSPLRQGRVFYRHTGLKTREEDTREVETGVWVWLGAYSSSLPPHLRKAELMNGVPWVPMMSCLPSSPLLASPRRLYHGTFLWQADVCGGICRLSSGRPDRCTGRPSSVGRGTRDTSVPQLRLDGHFPPVGCVDGRYPGQAQRPVHANIPGFSGLSLTFPQNTFLAIFPFHRNNFGGEEVGQSPWL
ncbi:hypothetical protein P7K49_011969 [Saguinus oedipus]|uniref:Uncharacterized protein n=1 Tax=Saguinus oedipus TaxID=9490 RepID=A0ABQ9VVP6_SAGOE|nr:hypothetical protein P7K49_011969 [Saguinus oedipus]